MNAIPESLIHIDIHPLECGNTFLILNYSVNAPLKVNCSFGASTFVLDKNLVEQLHEGLSLILEAEKKREGAAV